MIVHLIETLDNVKENAASLSLLKALEKNSDSFDQYDQLAQCYFKLKKYDDAYECAKKAYQRYSGSNSYAAKYNLMNAANHANYPEKALEIIAQLELVNPKDIELQTSKAFALFMSNRKSEAETVLRNLLSNSKIDEKTRTSILFNLGTYELLRDEFQSGMRKFLFEGRKMGNWKKPQLPFAFWDGTIEKDKTIIVRAEAGIGDEFINIRFLSTLKERGMKPIWFTDRTDMTSIFRRNGFQVINKISELTSYDNICWTHSMDLPVYLNLQYDDLWKGPYITSDKEKSSYWKDFFANSKLKIGIRWQGNPSYDQDLHRSLPLNSLFKSIEHVDADFYSLQKDNGLEELKELPIEDLNFFLSDYEQTLAAIDNLDLVITSCTSIVHAAAAMGKETILFTPISSYYTWCHTTEKSPWYGNNLTILRQTTPRCWKEPIEKLKEIMDARYAK